MPEEVQPSQPTRAFGPVEQADETRQAQQQLANDAIVDVNVNSILARSQAITIDVYGKSFAENYDRRGKLFDHFAALISKPKE